MYVVTKTYSLVYNSVSEISMNFVATFIVHTILTRRLFEQSVAILRKYLIYIYVNVSYMYKEYTRDSYNIDLIELVKDYMTVVGNFGRS